MANDVLVERQNDFQLIETNAFDGLYVYIDREISEGEFNIPSITDIKESISEQHFKIGENHDFMHGDIIYLNNRRRKISGVLNQNARQNTLLVTEKCDNLCSFCSQPPNEKDDIHLYLVAAEAINNYRDDTVVGITGGEPTLDKEKFLKFLTLINSNNKQTPLHILTNGRSFSDKEFTKEVLKLSSKREIVWGIPVHGHNQKLHDDCVGAEGAFFETLEGLMNLSYAREFIELRTVVTQKNYKFLPHISELITSSLPFVATHAIMNLEPRGWARRNFEDLTIPPQEQMKYIDKAVSLNTIHGISSSLYNYPLCSVPSGLRRFYHKSISDWKNYYPDFCNTCVEKKDCGGFFSSSIGVYLDYSSISGDKHETKSS